MMVMMHGGAVVAHRVMARRPMMPVGGRVAMARMVAMMRTRGGRAGRHGERGGDDKRQADEFQGCFSQFQCPRLDIRTQAAGSVQTNAAAVSS